MKPNHLCFLVRMWQVGSQDSAVRALLEEPSNREVVGFASVEDLCAYLEKKGRDLAQAPANEGTISEGDTRR